MRFNVDRMGEQYQGVSLQWLASITTVAEHNKIAKLEKGERIYFLRDVTGPVGKQAKLEVVRV